MKISCVVTVLLELLSGGVEYHKSTGGRESGLKGRRDKGAHA